MTFIADKIRAFDSPTERPPKQSLRPDGRLKRYESNADVRSWIVGPNQHYLNQRQQHILSAVRAAPLGICLGRYLPVPAMIEALCQRRVRSCERKLKRVKKQLEKCGERNGVFQTQLYKLYEMLEGMHLTPEQRRQLRSIKALGGYGGGGDEVKCAAMREELERKELERKELERKRALCGLVKYRYTTDHLLNSVKVENMGTCL